MQQSEKLSMPLDNGALVLKEYGSEGMKSPFLSLFSNPEGEDDGQPYIPAKFFCMGSSDIKAMYRMLKEYYEPLESRQESEPRRITTVL